VPEGDYTIPIGKAEVKREGSDITLVTYGLMVHHSLAAAGTVQSVDSTSVEVIDLRSISPWDKECVLESVKKTGKALVVYEDNITGGFGAEVAATIAEEAFDFLDAPIVRVASPDVPIAPYAGVLEEYILPNPEKIAAGIRRLTTY
jgi:2-oxoisovalerate dehydrogenase E1 component beta subunit